MVTPSTGVTAHPDAGPNSALCNTADQKMSGPRMCRWFGGRILTFHAVGPGPIPDGFQYLNRASDLSF